MNQDNVRLCEFRMPRHTLRVTSQPTRAPLVNADVSSDSEERIRRFLDHGPPMVLTGAGMSTDSGIPDYRGPDGTRRVTPMQHGEFVGSSAARQRYWARSFIGWQRFSAAAPNAGHRALAHLGTGGLIGPLVTQNVDGLHQRAGSVDVLALHGNIFEDRWLDPCAQACATGSAEPGRPPCCARCGNRLRPGVVWFGEMLPHLTLARAESAARDCDLMLVVGTSGQVYPAAGLAHEARAAGARVLILNPDDTGLDGVAHLRLRGTAAALLPQLLKD